MNEQPHAEAPVAPEPERPEAVAGAGEGGTPEAAEALSEIEQLTAQVAALKEEVLRARADLDNQRKRAQRDVEAAYKYANERFVHELLPFKDSLDLGMVAAQSATDVDSLREGIALSHKLFSDFFAKQNIREINPLGERFDPDFHEAMTMEESTSAAPGTVVRVMQSGYVLNDRLLRPALVVVAKAPGGAGA